MQCMDNLGCFSQGKWAAIVQCYSVVVFSCVQCFHVSVIHQTLTWIAGLPLYVIILMHAYIYTGVAMGTLTTSQHNILTPKNSQILIVLQTRFKPLVFESRVDALPIEPPRHPLWTLINKLKENAVRLYKKKDIVTFLFLCFVLVLGKPWESFSRVGREGGMMIVMC